MGKGMQTREAILDEALRTASKVGLEGLSLAPLADTLKLSKSGLFAHFKSKEALQLDIVEEAMERFKRQVLLPESRERDPEKRLRAVFMRYLDWIRGSEADGGCLFMTMAQEYDDRPGPIRDRLVASQRDWRTFLTTLIKDGAAAGAFRPDPDAGQAVFDILGAALAFQHSAKLLDDRSARRRALAALDRVISDLKG